MNVIAELPPLLQRPVPPLEVEPCDLVYPLLATENDLPLARLQTFRGARLREPIDCSRHIQFMERRIAGKPLVDAPSRPTHPCPTPSYPAEGQDWVDVSLRQWAKSTKRHSTDQNCLCEYRYNRHIHCAGKIPSAGETPVVWRSMGLCGDERGLRFIHPGDNARLRDFPFPSNPTTTAAYGTDSLLKRIAMERNRIRLRRLAANYKGDVLLKTSDALLAEWNAILAKHGLPEEIDFYLPSFTENRSDGRERSSDDEKTCDRQFDGINYEGMRETEGGKRNDHQSRSKWFPRWQDQFNPDGLVRTPETEEEVRSQPNFPREAERYDIMFSNKSATESAKELVMKPNTLVKHFANTEELREMFHGVDWSKVIGNYFCIVTLDGKNYLKMLGKADAPLAEVLANFVEEWSESEVNAIKQVHKSAKADGTGERTIRKREREAVTRIRAAYEVVIGALIPASEGFGCTYHHFQGHQELISILLDNPFVRLEGAFAAETPQTVEESTG